MPEIGAMAAAVRARFAQALARRAQAHEGAARRLLDERLAALAAATASAPSRPEPAPAPAHGARPAAGALAALAAHAARQKTAPVPGPPAPAPDIAAGRPAPSVPPATVQFFKRTWSRLSADQRLAQSRATLPDNAGPLNSHHLVHRSLTLMRELSPEYLERFVAYVDALQWLEQASEAAAQEPRPPGPRKSMPARR